MPTISGFDALSSDEEAEADEEEEEEEAPELALARINPPAQAKRQRKAPSPIESPLVAGIAGLAGFVDSPCEPGSQAGDANSKLMMRPDGDLCFIHGAGSQAYPRNESPAVVQQVGVGPIIQRRV